MSYDVGEAIWTGPAKRLARGARTFALLLPRTVLLLPDPDGRK